MWGSAETGLGGRSWDRLRRMGAQRDGPSQLHLFTQFNSSTFSTPTGRDHDDDHVRPRHTIFTEFHIGIVTG
jgi:hypothetical protein